MIFLSENALPQLITVLEGAGHRVCRVKASELVYPEISSHADIYMCRVGNTLLIDDGIVTSPSIREEYEAALSAQAGDPALTPLLPSMSPSDGSGHIVFSMGNIGFKYPFDVPYNAVTTDLFFIHNTSLTSPDLLDRARYQGLDIINVKQGYTRCSCLPVGSRGLITADRGIAGVIEARNAMIREEMAADADKNDADVSNDTDAAAGINAPEGCEKAAPEDTLIDLLVIRPGHIVLKGFDSGFIGGTAGEAEGKIYFNGDLMAHPDGPAMADFIRKHGLEPVWFSCHPLTDIGSIISI